MIALACVAVIFAIATACAALADVVRPPDDRRPADPPSHVHVVRSRPYDWNDEP